MRVLVATTILVGAFAAAACGKALAPTVVAKIPVADSGGLGAFTVADNDRDGNVYLTYSDRLIEGSPQNSVTAVAVDHGTPIPLK